MELFLFWLSLSIAITMGAIAKGRSGFLAFIVSIFLSPFVSGIYYIIAPAKVNIDQKEILISKNKDE